MTGSNYSTPQYRLNHLRSLFAPRLSEDLSTTCCGHIRCFRDLGCQALIVVRPHVSWTRPFPLNNRTSRGFLHGETRKKQLNLQLFFGTRASDPKPPSFCWLLSTPARSQEKTDPKKLTSVSQWVNLSLIILNFSSFFILDTPETFDSLHVSGNI
jgi:hypothetical protein